MSLPLISLLSVLSAALMPAAGTAQETMPAALAPTGLAHQGLQHISSVSSVIGLGVVWVQQQHKMAPLQMHQHPRWWHHTAGSNTEISDLSSRCHQGETERKHEGTASWKPRALIYWMQGTTLRNTLLLRVNGGRVVNIWAPVIVGG